MIVFWVILLTLIAAFVIDRCLKGTVDNWRKPTDEEIED